MKPEIITWIVVHTKPRQEVLFEEKVRALGVEVYVPMARTSAYSHHIKHTVISSKPLFPSYVFLRARTYMPWLDIHKTQGFSYVVSSAGVPVHVRNGEVMRIKMMEQAGEFDDVVVDESKPEFKKGQQATISKGLMKGSICTILSIRNASKAGVAEIQLFAGSRPMKVPLSILRNI
jgi:transcription antitermination factor NusG